ncbi:hypothetical protein WJX77_009873 [Trebouxia sp. C0004]
MSTGLGLLPECNSVVAQPQLQQATFAGAAVRQTDEHLWQTVARTKQLYAGECAYGHLFPAPLLCRDSLWHHQQQ